MRDLYLWCSPSQKRAIAEILGMPLGLLPIKYPLINKKLSFVDCLPFLDKLKARTDSWTSSKLSYGGRLQLINSVLIAMIRYWTSTYFLPRKVLREIERILRTFLWGGARKAKVKWKELCKPKKRRRSWASGSCASEQWLPNETSLPHL